MLTGTPLDLTPFGGLLAALGWIYWAVAAGLILLALWLPKPWWLKLAAAALTAGAVVYPLFVRPVQNRVDELQQAQAEYQQRLTAATAHFEMRCKSAGEFIKRTVQDVEGVVWMKWRDKRDVNDDFDQFKLFDPFGRDCDQEGCIEQLLTLPDQSGRFEAEVAQRKGRYRFVESTDPSEARPYRYTGVMRLSSSWTPAGIAEHKRLTGQDPPYSSYLFQLDRKPIDRITARYGITWSDISTPEDREHWIAGGSLQVIDLQTNEVIAERIGYMMDRGLGDRAGFRTPWLEAQHYACPLFRTIGPNDARRARGAEGRTFVMKVLASKGSN
jgi:hypothetical protein